MGFIDITMKNFLEIVNIKVAIVFKSSAKNMVIGTIVSRKKISINK